MNLTIPGRKPVQITDIVLDFNGTIALDGVISELTQLKMGQLSELATVHVITADTNGSVIAQCEHLPVHVYIVSETDQQNEKKKFVEKLQTSGVVSIGNGSIDTEMFAVSAIAIAVIGQEGCATDALLKSDVIVTSIDDAFDLLLKENRLIATLRK